MAWLRLFGKKQVEAPKAEALPARRFGSERERMFDLAHTQALAELFAVPRDRRDADWSGRFWDAAWWGSIALAEPQVFAGPDGFPYLRLDLPRPDTPFDSQCLGNLAGGCVANGVGAAFFASPDDPAEAAQYVLSLGLLDSLVRYDSPDGDPIDLAEAAEPGDEAVFDVEAGRWSQTLMTREAHEVLIGTPSAEFLPPPVAAALGRHLEREWGLADPRVQLVVDRRMRPHRSLVVGRKRSEFRAEEPADDMTRALLWYLTPRRSVMLMPEEWSLDEMTPLRDLAQAAL